VGELPLEVQAKLLRVLEDGRITPVGADRAERQVNVRVVAATNRNLIEMVRQGAFRIDLYHRLSALTIEVPALCERGGDVGMMLEERLEFLRGEGHAPRLSSGDRALLLAYDWPGNVRQLHKVVDAAVLLDAPVKELLRKEAALGPATGSLDDGEALLPRRAEDIRPIEEVRCAYTLRAFELLDRNTKETARRLELSPNTLRKYLREADGEG
jgi:DNA-binding NtrC family response regulator